MSESPRHETPSPDASVPGTAPSQALSAPHDVVDAVRRGVEVEDAGPDEGALRLRCRLSTGLGLSPAQLWPLLTEPQELATWYGPVSGDLREGGTFAAPGGAHGRVLEVDPPHRLDLTWEYGENVDDLRIELDPSDDGTTTLDLLHTVRVPRDVFEQYGPGAVAVGWEIAVLGLAARTGGWTQLRLDPPTPSPSWLAGDEGADYVRQWSIRWAAASVAAGTDDAEARRAEIATTRAYGGPQEDRAGV